MYPPINKVGYATMLDGAINDGKSDKGKPRWDLLPFSALDEVVEILTEGVEEYGEESWKNVPNAKKRYFAALMRHLTDWWRGVEKDKKSGHHPLAHVCCNVLFLLWLDRDNTKKANYEEE